MTSTEGESADEVYKLTQKALFVQLPTRPIDLDTIPQDGNEFIHKSRLEDANLLLEQQKCVQAKPLEENEQKLMRQHARKAAMEFSRYGLKLTCDRDKKSLMKKFPKKLEFPKPNDIQEWCHFCLGAKLCSEIYEEPDEETEGHLPLLSIVVHFDQYTAFTVLGHLHEWFLNLGMEDSIGRWVYAVLACIKKPLKENTKKLINIFYRDCKKRLKDCDESERSRLYLISAIMEYYFCLSSDRVGPTLETFMNLQI